MVQSGAAESRGTEAEKSITLGEFLEAASNKNRDRKGEPLVEAIGNVRKNGAPDTLVRRSVPGGCFLDGPAQRLS